MAEMSWLLLKKSNRFPLLIYNGTSFAPLGIHEFVCHAIVHYSYIIQCSLDACLRLIQDRIDSVTFCDGSVICQEYVLSYCCSRLLLLFFFSFFAVALAVAGVIVVVAAAVVGIYLQHLILCLVGLID